MAFAASQGPIVILLTFTLFVVQISYANYYTGWNRIVQLHQNNLYHNRVHEKVSVIVLYETLCPYCIRFYGTELISTLRQLSDYIDLKTYPYGNAKRSADSKGHVKITCQHGEAECYGNKLHACAIDVLQNATRYVEFNGCMMPLRSNDAAADQCGRMLRINSSAIKMCAKSNRGSQLLNYYGVLSGYFKYKGVPTIFVNHKNIDDKPLKKAVCDALKTPPKICRQ